ncbi:MAG: hypothetical protein PHF24_00290 [Syntrophomonas sp.]|nr:hypothetical protein [Syntrophomonas sp.]
MLKCEYPEGCRLDLWAKVIKAKYIEKGVKVLDQRVCIPVCDVGGYITEVEDFKIKVNSATETFSFNKVRICINFDLCLIVSVATVSCYQVFALTNNIFEDTIELCEFDPPLTTDEFKSEVDSSEIILKNWDFDYDIEGRCEDRHSPCHSHLGPVVDGTCLDIQVYVDIIDKLGKMHDIIVFGELDPEVDY